MKSSRTSARNNRVGICGYNDMGKALAAFFPQAHIHDANFVTKRWPSFITFGYIHVCMHAPFDQFVEFLIQHGSGALIFLHLDVEKGFTQKLQKATGNEFIVHAPFRGISSDIQGSLASFSQPIGADSAGAARLAVEHLQRAGIHTEAIYHSYATEDSPRAEKVIELDTPYES
jgi:hypothetical protein